MSSCHEAIPISDQSQVGEARRRAVHLATEAGMTEVESGQVAIVATELATNLARHARQGVLLLCPQPSADGGLEILSVDHGPGMCDVVQCLADGYSTYGTAGNGLGAVRRLSSQFDICSYPSGTIVLARVSSRKNHSPPTAEFACGVVSLPALHETECGDTWRIAQRPGELAVFMADGLGHGPQAATAAREAATAFEQDPFAPLTSILKAADARMRGTRGGAVAVANFQAQTGVLKYAGVGNISGSLRTLGENTGRGLVSHNGTLGVQAHRFQEFEYPCPRPSLLIMHSDGLQSRWTLDSYPGLAMRHPALIAGVLQRDFTRGRDDVTVAAIRLAAS